MRITLLFLCTTLLTAATVEDLRCEGRPDPLGMDLAQPRLTWRMAGDARGERQTAWRMLVATNPERLARDEGDAWDSGRVAGDPVAGTVYAGKPMAAFDRLVWKVKAWDQTGKDTPWSAPATWSVGPQAPEDWHGTWITAAYDPKAPLPYFRRAFTVSKPVVRAEWIICGLGHFTATVNGKEVTDAVLEPGWTTYAKTCLYRSYDVTRLLTTSGEQVLGVSLGNGMYNVPGGRYTKWTGSSGPPKVIAELRILQGDGSVTTVVTDNAWTTTPGPVTFSCVYGGEDFDARRAMPGWDRPGFTATGWAPATPCDGPGGRLRGESVAAPSIHTYEVLTPVNVKELKPGITVYDLGQNAAQIPRLSVRGPAGSSVRMIPAELVHRDGSVDRISCGQKLAWCQYTLDGTGTEETWQSQFFYQGARYWQVERLPAEGGTELPAISAFAGVVVQGNAPSVGTFQCSDDLFNRIHTITRWAQRSNMVSVMTDCPHREKLGWLEEDHLNGPALRYEFDFSPMSAKIVNDIADSQGSTGMIPTTAPEYPVFGGGFRDSPEWSATSVLVPWQDYQFTGDPTLLRRAWPTMTRWVAYLGSTKAKDHLLDYGLGDWYDIGPKAPGYAQLTPKGHTATAFYYIAADILSQAATVLGKEDEAKTYAALAADIRTAFRAKYRDPATGQFATGSQTANALPLVVGLADDAERLPLLNAVVDDVTQRGLTAGDVGYRYLLRALADGGRSDVVWSMNRSAEKPGYAMILAKGATALTEAWDARAGSSQNHFMLGQIVEWFYHDLAGIRPAAPGFTRIDLAPAVVGDLTEVSATYRSIRGPIASHWRLADHQITLTATLPPGTTTRVRVPCRGARVEQVHEGGHLLAEVAGAKVLGTEVDAILVEVPAGTYVFTAPW